MLGWLKQLLFGDRWRYICVECGHEFSDKKPERTLTMVLTCPQCKVQLLIGGEPDRPYAIDPRMLKEDTVCCRYGCDFEMPYGFVPMGGCPIHD